MTPAQARELIGLLRAAYPDARAKVNVDTIDLWLEALRPLDHKLGERAVRSLIASSKFWPSVAELNEQVAIARDQAAHARREAERRVADRLYEDLPRPPLRDIPAAVELVERFNDPPPPLELATDGVCDDGCGRTGVRYRLGRFQVCADCGRRRLRVAGRAA